MTAPTGAHGIEPARSVLARDGTVDLDAIAARVRRWYGALQVPGAPYGRYRMHPFDMWPEHYASEASDFYASADVAWLRWITGEDLSQLPAAQRTAWSEVLNGFQRREDGAYPRIAHSVEHANASAVIALSVLGARHRFPVSLYDAIATEERLVPWLEALPFHSPWRTSHLVWGLVIPFSHSRWATATWHDTLFGWLEDAQDPETGWWRKGVPLGRNAPTVSGLGGAVHIFPLHRHHGRPVPRLDRMVEQVLRWHEEDGFLRTAGSYGEMDGAYVLALGAELVPEYRARCCAAGEAYLEALLREYHELPEWFFGHVHRTMGLLSGLAYLQRLLPDRVVSRSGTPWHDIFDWPEIYQLDRVWPLEEGAASGTARAEGAVNEDPDAPRDH